MRLYRAVSNWLNTDNTSARKLILADEVRLNGVSCAEPDRELEPGDRVVIAGKKGVYIVPSRERK